jgi:hypothetical protein
VQYAYGRFLSATSIKAPNMATAIKMPSTAGTKYMSAMDCGIGVGAAVACGARAGTIFLLNSNYLRFFSRL